MHRVEATAAEGPTNGRRRSRALGWHAGVVGIGWFVLSLPVTVAYGSSTGLRNWVSQLPSTVQGMAALLVVLAVVPVVWPVYLAIGWHEGRLAERLAAGDTAAIGPAERLLMAQGIVFAAIAVAVAAYAMSADRGSWTWEHASLAWLVPAAISAAHIATARRIRS